MSGAERSQRYRDRQRRARLQAVREPGPVRVGLEKTLADLTDPDPGRTAIARHLADAIDDRPTAQAAASEALRKLIEGLEAAEPPQVAKTQLDPFTLLKAKRILEDQEREEQNRKWTAKAARLKAQGLSLDEIAVKMGRGWTAAGVQMQLGA